MASSMGFRGLVPLPLPSKLQGVWLLPRRDSHPLNTSDFSGHTQPHAVRRLLAPLGLAAEPPPGRPFPPSNQRIMASPAASGTVCPPSKEAVRAHPPRGPRAWPVPLAPRLEVRYGGPGWPRAGAQSGGARALDDRKCVCGVLEGDRTREHLPRRVFRELGGDAHPAPDAHEAAEAALQARREQRGGSTAWRIWGGPALVVQGKRRDVTETASGERSWRLVHASAPAVAEIV